MGKSIVSVEFLRPLAEYPEFVLYADYFRIAQVQEIGSETILAQIVLADLKLHLVRILVAIPSIIHSYDRTINSRVVLKNRRGKISRKGRDSALSR